MGEKVFLLRDADVSGKKLLWDAGLEVVVAKGAGESAWIEEMQRERPAAILTRADRVSAAMMDACPGLKAIGKQGIGLDCIDMDVATQRGIQVVYAPVSNVNAAAEHTMFMIMACARRFSYVDRVFRGGAGCVPHRAAAAGQPTSGPAGAVPHAARGGRRGTGGAGQLPRCLPGCGGGADRPAGHLARQSPAARSGVTDCANAGIGQRYARLAN